VFVLILCTDIVAVAMYAICILFHYLAMFLELHLTTSELWFGQEQEGILP